MKTVTAEKTKESTTDVHKEAHDSLRVEAQAITDSLVEVSGQEDMVLLVYDTTQPKDTMTGLHPLKAVLYKTKTNNKKATTHNEVQTKVIEGGMLTEDSAGVIITADKSINEKSTQNWIGYVLAGSLLLLVLLLLILYIIIKRLKN